jgi:hypothetical protein
MFFLNFATKTSHLSKKIITFAPYDDLTFFDFTQTLRNERT